MDSFQNPQQFENSSIVQKSSKTGIFSNKRLLVIKNGYLYYFSKVPKGYKSHVPNILTTFTDLPKSSIEIKNILDIRLESTKSSNLIIKFYLRDMIDRQDIRKSIDTHSYMLPQKKGNTDFDQWKFTFTTVLQCRLWFNALIKLKDYFKNLDIKFEKFVSNFDKRNSVVVESKQQRTQSQLKLPVSNKNSLTNSNISYQASEKSRKTQPVNFDASKFIGSIPQKQLSPINNKVDIQKILNTPLKIHIQETKAEKLMGSSKIISQEDQDSQNGYHPEISEVIEPQIVQVSKQPIKRVQLQKSTLKQSHLIQPINEDEQIKIRQLEQQIRQQVKQQVQKKVRQQLQLKLKQKLEKEKKQQMYRFRAQVQLKQMKIKQLQTQIHIKHLANMQKQKQIQQEKKQLQNKIYQQQQKLKQYQIQVQNQIKQQAKHNNNPNLSLENHNKHNKVQNSHQNIIETSNRKWIQAGDQYQLQSHSQHQQDQTYKQQHNDKTKPSIAFQNHNIEVHQFSVQTDDQQFPINHSIDQFQPHFNFSKEMSHSKQLNLSKQTKIRNSFFSDYLTSNRNTVISQKYRIQEDILPSDQQQQKQQFSKFHYFYQLERIFQNGISSSEKIQREIKLLRYVNFIKNQIVKISHQYIEKNHPTQCISFEKGFLSFDLACAPGKVMNIGGQKKLIYSNKVHENLKRKFKIYQKLQNQIIKLIKNKKNFPVRVPLCTLVEYKGYTILGKVEICCNEQDSIEKDKYLKYILPAVFNSSVHLSKTIQIDDQSQYFMVKVLKPFKLTNEQKSSELFNFNNNFHLFENQINKCRSSSLSICYEKLSKEINQVQDQNQNMQINSSDQQTHNNKIYVLRLIKLMRELKKIFKSIDPFSHKNDQESKMKSQFVQKLISKPEDLLALIPCDIDFKVQDLQCGQFWSLLQFFLGVRMNDPIKQQTQNPSYRLVPVVRTFHLQYLLCNQYCQKIDKYLSMNNIESAENCLKLFKKISFNEFHVSLTEIKILLKKKQYSIAQEKIHYLRQSLPIHDLKNIQINAYLIQCYIFMGLQTEALKQIKSSLQYVEYLFGDRKNTYEENLLLLMAETLLKMGNIKEAIKLYKSLLKFDKIDKQQILISFAENLVQDFRFDPNDSIPFLIECIEELNSADKKIELFLYIAKLYLRSQRKDKCIFYLQKAYELGVSSKSYKKILNVYQMLMNNLPSQSRKQTLYQNFMNQMENKFFSNHQNCRYFNTINLYQLFLQNQEINISQIVYFLDEIKIQSVNELSCNLELKDWQTLKSCAKLFEGFNPKQIESNIKTIKKILQSVDIEKLLVQLRKVQKSYQEM